MLNQTSALKLAVPALLVAGLAITGFRSGAVKSGPQVGQSLSAFEPTHISGPDAGTRTCPVCKYGPTPAVQVWINQDNLKNVGKIATKLESLITEAGPKNLKAFIVYVNPKGESADAVAAELAPVAKNPKTPHVAVTFVTGPKDEAVETYRINTDPSVKNTVLVYSDRIVVANFVNLTADDAGLRKLSEATQVAISKRSSGR